MKTQTRAWPPGVVDGSEALTREVQGHGEDMLQGEAGLAALVSRGDMGGKGRGAWRVGEWRREPWGGCC